VSAEPLRRPLQLDPVEHEETLRWLCHLPGYRELIRERVSDAQKHRRRMDSHRERGYAQRDVDTLGREIEGCG
jgi:hypothetical protein